MTDHDKLRELAQNATPGPYHVDYIESGEHGLFIDQDRAETSQLGCGGTEVAGFLTKPNAEFIAAANPTVVLALLDELRDAKAQAWDEGRDAALEAFDSDGYYEGTTNPYMEEA